MAGEYPDLPNYGYGLHVPAEAILQMLPFTPQYKEAQVARQLQQAQLSQVQQLIAHAAELHPKELEMLSAQIGAQGAATEASRAQAGKARAETPGVMDTWLNRAQQAAEIGRIGAGTKAAAQQGDYYEKLGQAQTTEQLMQLLQTLPLFDEVVENVETPGLFGSKVTQQKRQVPGAQRTAVIQQLLQKYGVPFAAQQPQASTGVQPGMAEALDTAKKQATGGVQPQAQPQAPQAQLPREGFGRTAQDLFGQVPLAIAKGGRAVGRAVPMLQPGIEQAITSLGLVPSQSASPPVQGTPATDTVSQEQLSQIMDYIGAPGAQQTAPQQGLQQPLPAPVMINQRREPAMASVQQQAPAPAPAPAVQGVSQDQLRAILQSLPIGDVLQMQRAPVTALNMPTPNVPTLMPEGWMDIQERKERAKARRK